MSIYNKVVWSEGMFLNPQHFQQLDRYLEQFVEGRCSANGAYSWGWHDFSIDQKLLNLGKLSISHGRGVLPDGTPFDFPGGDEPPPVMEVPEGVRNAVVYLGIPVRRPEGVDVLPPEGGQSLARYQAEETEVRDTASDTGGSSKILIGKLRLRLLLETDDLSGYACVGALRILESKEDKHISLDENYIPPCLDCKATPRLSGFLNELGGMLHLRGESIAGRLADARRAGTAEIADYLMLQLLNRLEPMVLHLVRQQGLHPEVLYKECLQIAGELATFSSGTRRPPQFPVYLHDELQDTFAPVIASINQYLAHVVEQNATALTFIEAKHGIRVAQITDRSLIDSAQFVLAAKANVPGDTLRQYFPAQAKLGSVERIRQLVQAQVPGIPLKPLAVAPRQLPYHAGFTYFELEKSSDYWRELRNSGGFALHIGGEFPGLELEFWAIKE